METFDAAEWHDRITGYGHMFTLIVEPNGRRGLCETYGARRLTEEESVEYGEFRRLIRDDANCSKFMDHLAQIGSWIFDQLDLPRISELPKGCRVMVVPNDTDAPVLLAGDFVVVDPNKQPKPNS